LRVSFRLQRRDTLFEPYPRHPAQLNYAHGGPGSAISLAGELLQSMTSTKVNGVAYRGTPPGRNDLIGGRMQLMFADVGGAINQIEAGKVRPIQRRCRRNPP
jgi:tripartite-type tricarboxylate transporter receptor subunit TctC